MDKMIKVTQYMTLPVDMQGRPKVDALLDKLKEVVRQLRAENPEIAGGSLYDVGIVPGGASVEVNLYFEC